MTEANARSTPPNPAALRSEFTDFYDATYPAVAGELLALTGNIDLAHAASRAAYSRAWRTWSQTGDLDDPTTWVRADAVRRSTRPQRANRLLETGLPPTGPMELDPEDEVLVAGLQRLPVDQRLPLVLHYMAQLPVESIVAWFGGTPGQVEHDLDEGFETLVHVLDWPTDDDGDPDDVYTWTAEALEDSAQRLRAAIPVPPPTLAFRSATVTKVARRGAPATAAAAAAAVGLVVYLSPAPAAAPAAAAFTVAPAAAAPPIDDTPAAPVDPPATSSVETTTTALRATATPRSTRVRLAASPAGTTTSTTVATITVVPTATPAGTTTVATTTTTPPPPPPSTTTTPPTTPPTTTPAAGSGTGDLGGEGSADEDDQDQDVDQDDDQDDDRFDDDDDRTDDDRDDRDDRTDDDDRDGRTDDRDADTVEPDTVEPDTKPDVTQGDGSAPIPPAAVVVTRNGTVTASGNGWEVVVTAPGRDG